MMYTCRFQCSTNKLTESGPSKAVLPSSLEPHDKHLSRKELKGAVICYSAASCPWSRRLVSVVIRRPGNWRARV
jgi:hypothetical protein